MINKENIRLGNIFYPPIGEKMSVITELKRLTVKDGFVYLINGFIPEHCNGVPLNQEMLLTLGFIQRPAFNGNPSFSFGEHNFICIKDGDILFNYLCGPGLLIMDYKLEFIHDLQNIFFTFNKSELPVVFINMSKDAKVTITNSPA
jgi:hypothetical protein